LLRSKKVKIIIWVKMHILRPKSGLNLEDEGSMLDKLAQVTTHCRAREGNVRGSSNVVGTALIDTKGFALYKAGQETNPLHLRKDKFFSQGDRPCS
jgi:hypothetical protein